MWLYLVIGSHSCGGWKSKVNVSVHLVPEPSCLAWRGKSSWCVLTGSFPCLCTSPKAHSVLVRTLANMNESHLYDPNMAGVLTSVIFVSLMLYTMEVCWRDLKKNSHNPISVSLQSDKGGCGVGIKGKRCWEKKHRNLFVSLEVIAVVWMACYKMVELGMRRNGHLI